MARTLDGFGAAERAVIEEELAKSWEDMAPERCSTEQGREYLLSEMKSGYHRDEYKAWMI